MRTCLKIIAALCVIGGIANLVPALMLLNQRWGIVRSHWALFDIEIGGVPMSDAAAEAVLGAVGTGLLLLGCVLLRWPRKRAV